MEKTYMVKIPSGNFKVITSKNSLLSQQAVTSKGIPVPYTNLQLNPYPNTQLDLFWSDNLSFQCTALSTRLTNSVRESQYPAYTPTWEGCWLESSSQAYCESETYALVHLPIYEVVPLYIVGFCYQGVSWSSSCG